MRVVQLANFYTPVSGGLRTCVTETGRGYVAAGHERILVVPGVHNEDVVTAAGRQVTIASRRLPGFGGYRILTDRARVLTLLDAARPDVLEVNDKLSVGFLAPWARERGIPLVMFSHERVDEVIRARLPRWLPLQVPTTTVNRRLYELVDQVVVASGFSAAEFAPIGTAKVRRIPLGVDLDAFRPHDVADDPGCVRLILVSRLSREKSPQLAIEAVRQLRRRGVPVRLLIVGDGPLRQRLERRSAGLPVTFAGHVADRAKLAGMIANADIALSPSRAETFGLATLEALACGVPVVVPTRGAAAELVDPPGSGHVTDGTPDGIADGVVALLAVPSPVRRSAARLTAERYPWSATVSGLLDCFDALVGSARSGRSGPVGSGRSGPVGTDWSASSASGRSALCRVGEFAKSTTPHVRTAPTPTYPSSVSSPGG